MRWRERMAAEASAKVSVCLGLAVGICVPYFTLQRLDWFPLRTVPATALDRWIPFAPDWIGAYVSVALLVPLAPLLAARRSELARYAKGLAVLCAICFTIFLVFPVAGPRPEFDSAPALYRAIVAYDRPANSMPSLHAGLTVYSLLFLGRVLGAGAGAELSIASRSLGLAWGALILYSTLATKQHWLVDLPAGAIAAWGAHAFAWRSRAGGATAAPTLD